MSDTSQAPVAPTQDTVQVAFGVDQNGGPVQQQPYSTATETFGAGVEAPRAIQEQQARAAAQAAQQHPQQAVIDQEALLNRIRSEVKDQYFTQMEEMKQQLASMQQEREAEAARLAQEAEEARKAAEAAEEEKMGAKAFAEKRTSELAQELEALRQEQANREALFEKERQFMALQEFRAQRLAAEDAQAIIPQFRDMVHGNTQEEIEQSVQDLIARSNAVLQEVQAARQQQFIQQPGVSTRAPGALSGPMEMADTTRQLGKQDIDAMDMATYARLRPQLLQARPQGF